MQLNQALAGITTFVFDVDGVMTNGQLLILPDGQFVRSMNIKDGYALQLAVKKGYRVWVITGSHSEPVAHRLGYLGITHLYQREADKKSRLLSLMDAEAVHPAEVLFMGDDLPDLEAMLTAGVAACPADAAAEIRQAAAYISPARGGEGCVRDVIEKVLKLRGHWLHEGALSSK
jgi:3-deoxy-D-manno-octulosonate 8-phosphate phosphatase (KDO 8-P phosphatase)